MKIRIFRVDKGTGERVPWVIELDGELTVIAEYQAGGSTMGVTIPISEEATPATLSPSHSVARWAVEEVENPLPGTDDLRADYFAARRSLVKRHEDGGSVCPPCELRDLLWHYKEKLIEGGHLPR